MSVIDQYINTLKDNVETIDKSIEYTDAKKKVFGDIYSEINTPIFPYDNFKLDLKFKDTTGKKHVFTSITTIPQDKNKTLLDSFDVSYKYVDNNGQQCQVDFKDLLKEKFKDLDQLFNLKINKFKECYEESFSKSKVYGDTYLWTGGDGETTIELEGNFIVDENDNYLSNENGDFIVFE